MTCAFSVLCYFPIFSALFAIDFVATVWSGFLLSLLFPLSFAFQLFSPNVYLNCWHTARAQDLCSDRSPFDSNLLLFNQSIVEWIQLSSNYELVLSRLVCTELVFNLNSICSETRQKELKERSLDQMRTEPLLWCEQSNGELFVGPFVLCNAPFDSCQLDRCQRVLRTLS